MKAELERAVARFFVRLTDWWANSVGTAKIEGHETRQGDRQWSRVPERAFWIEDSSSWRWESRGARTVFVSSVSDKEPSIEQGDKTQTEGFAEGESSEARACWIGDCCANDDFSAWGIGSDAGLLGERPSEASERINIAAPCARDGGPR